MSKEKQKNAIDFNYFEGILLINLLRKNSNSEIYASYIMEHMEADLFKDKSLGKSFGVIKDFFERNNKLPNKSEINLYLNDSDTRIAFENSVKKLQSLDLDYNQDELLKNTEKFIKSRKIYKLFEKTSLQYEETKVLDENLLTDEFNKINQVSFINDFGIDFVEYANVFCNLLQEPEFYIPTGFQGLDDMLGGGLYKEGKAFYCFTGETNVGKSLVLSNLVWNTYNQGFNVLLVSLEMSEFRYYKRIATISSGIEQAYLKQKTNDFLEFASKNKDKTNKLLIKEFPPRSLSAKGLNAYITKLKERKDFKPDVIILDYHGLMKPSNSNIPKYESMQMVVQELRALSYLHQAPIISVAQLNRAGSGSSKSPGLDKLAASWDQAQDMDFIVSLWQTDEDKEMDLIRYAMMKTRDTGAKKREGAFNINPDTLKMVDDGLGGGLASEMSNSNSTSSQKSLENVEFDNYFD